MTKPSLHTKQSPFPGLRPFSSDENNFFFGREEHSATVLGMLQQYRFAAITGSSGSGKSSFITCGVLPYLTGGFLPGTGTDWRIIVTRPGNNPLGNLSKAIYESEFGNQLHQDYFYSEITETILRRSSFGLVEALQQLKAPGGQNILLIIDQFEELFRFRSHAVGLDMINETEAFVGLLLQSVEQTRLPVYLVITLRSDFLGECTNFRNLADKINQSNFLIPQMIRDNYRQVISGPLRSMGLKYDEALVQELLNSVEYESDQLPLLQHTLMRTYQYWNRYKQEADPLTLADYESAGTLAKALSIHADEIYESLDERGRQICRDIFTNLVEITTEGKGIRHPERVQNLANVARASVDETIAVINRFRATDTAFLTPFMPAEITRDTVIDITHECLMRNWDRLIQWIRDESEAVQVYQRLVETSAMYQSGRTGLLKPPDLQQALNWRRDFQPSLAWAKRYNPAYERAMAYLSASERKYKAEEKSKVRIQQLTLRRSRLFAVFMSLSALVFFGLMFYANVQREEAVYQTKIADELRVIAYAQKDTAVLEKQQEQERKEEALRQASAELLRRLELEKLSEMTEKEKAEAIDQAIKALQENVVLSEMNEEERKQREATQRALVETQQTISEVEKTVSEAMRKRLLSLSEALAVKSLSTGSGDLKTLLALQSYAFYQKYGTGDFNSSIYNALYSTYQTPAADLLTGFAIHEGAVRSVGFVPRTNTFFSTGGDGRIVRWTANDARRKPSVWYRTNNINRVLDVSPDGNWLAVGSDDNRIYLFNLKSAAQPRILEGHAGWVGTLVFSDDGSRLFSAGSDMTILKWDIAGSRSTIFYKGAVLPRCLDISRNYLAAGTDDGSIIVFKTDDGTQSASYKMEGNSVYSLRFSPDGQKLAVGDKNGKIVILQSPGLKMLTSYQGHQSRVLDLTFSPDGSLLASAGADNNLKILPVSGGSALQIKAHDGWVMAIDFSADSRWLVTASNKAPYIKLWPVQAATMAMPLCESVGRKISVSEWNEYIGKDINYEDACSILSSKP